MLRDYVHLSTFKAINLVNLKWTDKGNKNDDPGDVLEVYFNEFL